MTIGALSRSLSSMAGVFLLVLAPSADVIAFGLHDHVLTTSPAPGTLGSTDEVQGPTRSHHCELSVSVGELLPVVDVPAPVAVIAGASEPPASSPQHSPLVPLIPPRA